jgi:hypothetical protein
VRKFVTPDLIRGPPAFAALADEGGCRINTRMTGRGSEIRIEPYEDDEDRRDFSVGWIKAKRGRTVKRLPAGRWPG